MMQAPLTHCASVEVPVPARTAFEFMADGQKQTHWALGSWDRRAVGDDGLFVGVSRWDYTDLYVKLVSDPELLLVDYYVGASPESLGFGVSARIIPGEVLGTGPERSLIALTIWRTAHTSEADWARTAYVWPTEVQLIKSRIEYELAAGQAGRETA